MATSIKETAKKILSSKEFNEGTIEDRTRILIEFGFLIFDGTRLSAIRKYGKCKFFTTVHIKSEISRIEPPSISFDIH